MRKSFVIIVLFLVINTLGAQVPGYYNGGRRSSGGLFGGNQTLFHKGNSYTSGPTFGFAGSNSSQYFNNEYRGQSRYMSSSAIDNQTVSSSYGVRSTTPVAPARHDVQQSAPVQRNSSLLRREVWNNARTSGGGGGSIGGSDATNYGRRVKPQTAVANSVTSANYSSSTSSKSSASESGAVKMPGELDGSAPEGTYGFGEVPRDDYDAPVGDAIWLLALMAAAVALAKRFFLK